MFRRARAAAPSFERVTAAADKCSGFRLAPYPQALEEGLYEALRSQVPIVDAAITKLVRLTVGFDLECENESALKRTRAFFERLPVGVSGTSLDTFAEIYLDSLLSYGRAFGEIMVSERTRQITGLYCADCTLFRVRATRREPGFEVYSVITGAPLRTSHPERILYTVQNPTPKNPCGTSLLRGLPALSSILMQIYETVGSNFERAGNVRYALTYKSSSEGETVFASQRAREIATAWTDGMAATKAGQVKDFVAVGDVDIRVIGADGVILDTEVPVRQILEQLVAKLSIPSFLLGLSWSTTERMSSQQADILTSEIDYYRRLLEQVLNKILSFYCELEGIGEEVRVVWQNVNLQDEQSLAQARLYNAQAAMIEQQPKGGK